MAAPQAGTVAVVGLKALQRDLTKLAGKNSPLAKALQQAGRSAAEPVAAETRSRLPQSDRADAQTGRLAGDVRVTASKTGAAVRMGRANLRYAGWVEFGGTRKVPHQSERPFLSQGRYMFPAARRLQGTTGRLYEANVTEAFASYRWTNQTTNGEAVHD
jgi:hypothetical protein